VRALPFFFPLSGTVPVIRKIPWALEYEGNRDLKRDNVFGEALTAFIDLALSKIIKQDLDVLPSPRRGIGSKLYRLWEAAFGNTGPP
jgi:hypothetical protein